MRRFLKLFKGAGLLNLLGMTIAFAAIYIILVQVNYDWNFNSCIKDSDRIFAVTHPDWMDNAKYSANSNRPNTEHAMSLTPTVEAYCVVNGASPYDVRLGNDSEAATIRLNIMEATSGVFDVFGLEAVSGTFERIGEDNVAALSEKTARRLGLGIGDSFFLSFAKDPITITAIYKDIPGNSMFGTAEAIYSKYIEKQSINDYSEWSYRYFVKFNSAEDKSGFEQNAETALRAEVQKQLEDVPEGEELPTDDYIESYIRQYITKLFPLEGLQFRKEITGLYIIPMCNKTTTITLFIVAVLILLIALINFVNFSMAQVPARLKSVNTRKILGSSRLSLILEFMVDSAVQAVVALGFAYLAVRLFSGSVYADTISCPLELSLNIGVVLLTVASAIVMTVSSSVYPSLYMTSFSPAMAIKGTMGTVGKNRSFRLVLLGFQFAISIVFILCAVFTKKQYDFMMDYDMGFDKENLFTAALPVSDRDLYTAELLNRPEIKDVAWGASNLVATGRMSWGRDTEEGRRVAFVSYPVSYNFLDFMGIDIIEGRNFSEADEKCENGIFIFNKAAKDAFGFRLDTKLTGHKDITEIAGFCENFKFKPLHYEVEPFAFYVFGKEPWWMLRHLYIRSTPGTTYREVLQAVREVTGEIVQNFDTDAVELQFFDEELGMEYAKEQKLLKIITLFTALAVVISLVGIIGMLMFETRFRRKEIGIRKVYGAKTSEILQMFNRKYLYLLFVSFVIAVPVGYFAMNYYYSTFAYRSSLSWWIFALAFAIVAAVISAIVTLCSYSAALENPVDTLKNE